MKADSTAVQYSGGASDRVTVMAASNFGFRLVRVSKLAHLLFSLSLCASLSCESAAQASGTAATSGQVHSPAPPPASTLDVRQKWSNFAHETASSLTLGAGVFNAGFSQITDTDPKYGTNSVAFAKRFGASVADIATQNFFGDFVVASTFHEDPRYFRKGRGRSYWYRVGYAISRAVVIRNDHGGDTFNLDNVLGSAASSGFSNLYYPAPSRTGKATLMHFAIDVADNGFVNLAPEFWPDFRDKILKPHP
jgi:hypothetical protein